MRTKEIKNFFRPDFKKLAIVLIFLFLLSSLSLVLVSTSFFNAVFYSFSMSLSCMHGVQICTNSTQNISDFKQCYANEAEKLQPLLAKISGETDENIIYSSLLLAIYPGVYRLAEPLSNCIIARYVKYLPEFQETFNLSPMNMLVTPENCYNQIFFEFLLMIVYLYVVSCLIVWVYSKIKK